MFSFFFVNYLCHARDHLDRPWALVGTVLPGWVRILPPGSRIRSWMLEAVSAEDGSPRAELLLGLRRHFAENAWFHASPAFREVTAAVAAEIRRSFPDGEERRMRASFFAHVMTEMLLDAWLTEVRPESGRSFRDSLLALEPREVEREASAIAPAPVTGLSALVGRFREADLFSGYGDDEEVVRRLDFQGSRVRQPPLPEGFVRLVAAARPRVRARGEDLLAPPRA